MAKDQFTKSWITENALDIVSRYDPGVLTLRGLHYQLVSIGMYNTMQHYKRVVNAMISARRDGLVHYEAFSDHDRAMIGQTNFEETVYEDMLSTGKRQVELWMENYSKNRWENQPFYPEVFIEKKALQGVFKPICDDNDIALGACKGYPSLTFLNDTATRMIDARDEGKTPVILYFGDYDPSGEDIPRSIKDNLLNDFDVDVQVRRVALMKHQVIEWNLPPAPAKSTDSRTANWDGLGQVELDAVSPENLQSLCQMAINEVFDRELYSELMEIEKTEREEYRVELKAFVRTL